jgi:hypothetical protein
VVSVSACGLVWHAGSFLNDHAVAGLLRRALGDLHGPSYQSNILSRSSGAKKATPSPRVSKRAIYATTDQEVDDRHEEPSALSIESPTAKHAAAINASSLVISTGPARASPAGHESPSNLLRWRH